MNRRATGAHHESLNVPIPIDTRCESLRPLVRAEPGAARGLEGEPPITCAFSTSTMLQSMTISSP